MNITPVGNRNIGFRAKLGEHTKNHLSYLKLDDFAKKLEKEIKESPTLQKFNDDEYTVDLRSSGNSDYLSLVWEDKSNAPYPSHKYNGTIFYFNDGLSLRHNKPKATNELLKSIKNLGKTEEEVEKSVNKLKADIAIDYLYHNSVDGENIENFHPQLSEMLDTIQISKNKN